MITVVHIVHLSNRIGFVQHFLSTAQVRVVQLFCTQNAQCNRPMLVIEIIRKSGK